MNAQEFKRMMGIFNFNAISSVVDNTHRFYKGNFHLYKRLPRKLKKQLKNHEYQRTNRKDTRA